LVSTTLGGGSAIEIARSPSAHAPVSRYVPATHRARDELGLHPTVALPDALQRTAVWLNRAIPL
jgi:hypothetical protein